MINYRSHPEKGGRAAEILQMPEEKCEDETDSEAHEPSHEKESGGFQVLELLKNRHPFGQFAVCLGEYFRLERYQISCYRY